MRTHVCKTTDRETEGRYCSRRPVDGGELRRRERGRERPRESLERRGGLPMVDGRSGKHALSWQTMGWS